jgi:hypothetical protein
MSQKGLYREAWSNTMAIPFHVNENKSDIRSIKPGWYAMVEDGSLSFGPFASYEQCVRRISKATLATSDLKEFSP